MFSAHRQVVDPGSAAHAEHTKWLEHETKHTVEKTETKLGGEGKKAKTKLKIPKNPCNQALPDSTRVCNI